MLTPCKADGWTLATRYPTSTIYTLSTSPSSSPPTSYPAPLNHHSLYLPSLTSSTPFPDNYFDAIISRSLATTLRNDEWARAFFDCMRVLKPGGQIEVLSVDAHLSCEGPKLGNWVDEMLSNRLEAHGVSRQASDTVLDTMEIVGLENIRRARVALPAHSPKASPPVRAVPGSTAANPAAATQASQDSTDASRMMAFLGRHFYQDLYGKFLRAEQGEEWFWTRRDIREECERYKTKMVLTIACAVKPSGGMGESYLDI
jgi:SAM-dependent methyltransferase